MWGFVRSEDLSADEYTFAKDFLTSVGLDDAKLLPGGQIDPKVCMEFLTVGKCDRFLGFRRGCCAVERAFETPPTHLP